MKKLYVSVLITSALLLSFGCSTTYTRHVGRENWIGNMAKAALTTGDLSYRTTQFLVANALMEKFQDDPEEVIDFLADHIEHPELHAIPDNEKVRPAVNVLIELCMYHAQNLPEEEALKYWMTCCYYSYRCLFDKTIKPKALPYDALGAVAALRYYNISLAEVFAYLEKHKIPRSSEPFIPTIRGNVKFNKLKSDLIWSPKVFKQYMVCFDYLPKNFLTHSYLSGIGVPIIGTKNPDANPSDAKEFLMLARAYPFTFVLRFDSFTFKDNTISATPEYYDSFHDEATTIENFKIPLSKDFSIALGRVLEGKSYISGFRFMLYANKMGDLQGLYMVTPYNPKKIPVLLVHGLMSEPRTWSQVLNTLLGNKRIRENYQFWLYAYPTGQPVAYSAYQLRKALKDMKQKFDKNNQNPRFNDMVIIGHSMGGLLTRLMTQNSCEKGLIHELFQGSFEKADLTDEQRQFATDVLVFEELPFVKRVAFLSAPHQGSEMASWSIARFGSSLISLPQRLTDKAGDIVKKAAIASGIKKDDNPFRLATGIDNLEPSNRFVKAAYKLPMSKRIKKHSIIGDDRKAGQIGGTDGIVPYWSSHIEGVESELVIKSGHTVQDKPACIKELTRILMLHLRELENDKAN